ncbi:hypothetical protein [Nocardia brasiliensis]|uniref:hypothetical protein n=1 Tax=Nocardia brasiliensis TaxID=37326 RepID=UPI0011DD66A5|nr:hypothetical protein [Nocardia brasiliensis]
MVTNRQTRQAEKSAKHRRKRRRICVSVLFAALAAAVLGAGQATADDFDIPPGLDLGTVQDTLPAAGGELARGLLDPGQQATLDDALDAVAAVAADAPIAPLHQSVTWTQRSVPDPTPGPVRELLAFAQQATELAGARRDNSLPPVDHLIDQAHTLFGVPEDGPDPVAGLRSVIAVPAVAQEDSIARPLPSGLLTIAAPVLGVFAAPVGGGVPALAFLAPLLIMAADPAAAIGVAFTQFRDTLGAPASDNRRPAAVEFSVGAVLAAVPLLLIGGAATALAIGEVLLGTVLVAGPALAVAAAGALIAFAEIAVPVAFAVAGTLALPALLLGGLLVTGVSEVLAVLTVVGLLDVVGALLGGALVGLSAAIGAALFVVAGGVFAAVAGGVFAALTSGLLAAVVGGVLVAIAGGVFAAVAGGVFAALTSGLLAAVVGGVLLALLALPVMLAATALIVVVGPPLALLGLLAIPLLLLGAAAVAVLLDPGARGAVISAIRAALDRNCPQGNSGMAPTGTHFLDDVPDDPNSDQLVAALQRMLAPQPRPAPNPCPAPSQVPEPRSCPAPEPQPSPAPEPRSCPVPEPRSCPVPEPRSCPVPEPRSCPAPEPRSSPAPTPRPSPAPEPRSCPAPEPQPSPRPAPRPCPEQVPAPRSRPEPQPAPSQVPAPQSNPTPCPRLCPAPGRSANRLPAASRPMSRPAITTAVLIDPVVPSDLFRKFSMS